MIEFCVQADLVRNLHITDIGFYPKAKFHYRRRPSGVQQHILIYCTDGEGWLEVSGQHNKTRTDYRRTRPVVSLYHRIFIILTGRPTKNHGRFTGCIFKGEQADAYGALLSQKKTSLCNNATFSEERIALFDRMYSTLETGIVQTTLRLLIFVSAIFLHPLTYPDIFFFRSEKNRKI